MRRGALRGAALAAVLTSAGSAAIDQHVVRSGETLWTLAEHFFGDARLWPALYRANRDQIKDPTLVHPGQRLVVPAVEPAERPALVREGATARPK